MGSARVPNWVWAVLVGMHMTGLGWTLSEGRWMFPDSGRYLQAAENLRTYGQLYARAWPSGPPAGQAIQEFTIRSVGYPALVAGVLGTGGGVTLLLVLQNLLSLLNIAVVLKWWARQARPYGADWVIVLLGLLLFPAQVIYANAVMSEIPLQTAVMGIVVASACFIRTNRSRWFAGLSGMVVMALLLKPVFYPLAGLLGLLSIGLGWRYKRCALALVGMVPVVVVGMYMEWNRHRTGYFHFSSIAEINLLHYNAAGVLRQLQGPLAEEQWVAGVLREADNQSDFATRQRVIQARASTVLMTHPIVYARQHVQGMGALLLDPGRFDISQFFALRPLAGGGLLAQVRAGGLWAAVQTVPLGQLGILAVLLLANIGRLSLAVQGFWRLKHGEPVLRQGRWVAAGLMLYVALLTGPLGAARFLVPVWPLLFALALVGKRWRIPGSWSATKQPLTMREDQGQ